MQTRELFAFLSSQGIVLAEVMPTYGGSVYCPLTREQVLERVDAFNDAFTEEPEESNMQTRELMEFLAFAKKRAGGPTMRWGNIKEFGEELPPSEVRQLVQAWNTRPPLTPYEAAVRYTHEDAAGSVVDAVAKGIAEDRAEQARRRSEASDDLDGSRPGAGP